MQQGCTVGGLDKLAVKVLITDLRRIGGLGFGVSISESVYTLQGTRTFKSPSCRCGGDIVPAGRQLVHLLLYPSQPSIACWFLLRPSGVGDWNV